MKFMLVVMVLLTSAWREGGREGGEGRGRRGGGGGGRGGRRGEGGESSKIFKKWYFLKI